MASWAGFFPWREANLPEYPVFRGRLPWPHVKNTIYVPACQGYIAAVLFWFATLVGLSCEEAKDFVLHRCW